MAGTHIPMSTASEQILLLARVHGDPFFWHQVLGWDSEAINQRRALLYLITRKSPGLVRPARCLLGHDDSRVRALACAALGQARDRGSTEQVELLESDPSIRVRVAAKKALRAICDWTPHSVLPTDRQVGMRVVVSEDSVTCAGTYRRLIESLGCRVEVASTYEQTIKVARECRPSLIVTDNQKRRDNSSGLRMTEELARDPDLNEIAVIMVSADPIEGPFLWNGGDHFVHKTPRALEEVRRLLQDYLASLA